MISRFGAVLLLVAQTSLAADVSNTSLIYMYGEGYKLGASGRHLLTVEHFTSHGLGDAFFFLDVSSPFSSSELGFYGELVLNWSSRKLLRGGVGYGELLKDVSVATSLEFAPAGAYLLGGALDVGVPLFRVFRVTPYLRCSKDLSKLSFQVTWVWALPFTVGPTHWSFEGFLDYALTDGGTKFNLQTQPRLLLDAGGLLFSREKTLWVGVEYQAWVNKFGKDGVTESLPQYMARWMW